MAPPENPLPVLVTQPIDAVEADPVPQDARQQILRLLDDREDKHFVFFFGSPAAGKTVVLGSLLHAMQTPEARGRLFVHGAGDGYFKHGLALWDQIRTAFDHRSFPPRTSAGRTIQLHAQYRPADDQPPMSIVFLEMAGEDLRSVQISDTGGRALPLHIDQFIKVPGLKVAFVIVVAWNDAVRDDSVVDDFLSYLNEGAPHLAESRVCLLVTKWDMRPGDPAETADAFVRRNMPRTYNKLAGKRNIIQSFSVGKVMHLGGDEGDVIASFDLAASQGLFARLCESFAKPPRWKLWKR